MGIYLYFCCASCGFRKLSPCWQSVSIVVPQKQRDEFNLVSDLIQLCLGRLHISFFYNPVSCPAMRSLDYGCVIVYGIWLFIGNQLRLAFLIDDSLMFQIYWDLQVQRFGFASTPVPVWGPEMVVNLLSFFAVNSWWSWICLLPCWWSYPLLTLKNCLVSNFVTLLWIRIPINLLVWDCMDSKESLMLVVVVAASWWYMNGFRVNYRFIRQTLDPLGNNLC